MWGFTLEEVKPYIEFQSRNILFREAVLSFLGVGEGSKIDQYCSACKKSRGIKRGEPDEKCTACTKDIVVHEKKDEVKAIGKK